MSWIVKEYYIVPGRTAVHLLTLVACLFLLPMCASQPPTELDIEPSPLPEGFVRIEAGSFEMGSPADEVGRDEDETQHHVTITRDFFMQSHEVTQGEWQARMNNNPSSFPSCGSDCPIDTVNWYEAVEYANTLSREEGLQECYPLEGCSGRAGLDLECSSVGFAGLDCEGYRLPTEAEWEVAARAGTTTAWYCGSDESCVDEVAWIGRNSSYVPHRVGTRRANDWGLYDMSGNVWEWVWDWYDENGQIEPTVDPLGPDSPVGRAAAAGLGGLRSIRGGGYLFVADSARSASRSGALAGVLLNYHGFRLARTAR